MGGCLHIFIGIKLGGNMIFAYESLLVKHKVFISYYHHDDQYYKDYIVTHFGNQFINKSVNIGEYNSENSDEYIKRLIREDKITDSSVVVVLVGPNTKNRKHVDWEIYAGLRDSVNSCSGLVGILLPTFPLVDNYICNLSDLPARLADNVQSGFATLYTWDYSINNFSSIINEAYRNKTLLYYKKTNHRLQMQCNT